jgi:putative oxygen-independent coproporphyrinogen III oxidase
MGFHEQYWRLVIDIALTPLSLYIHFPWCIKKCPYCDFNSHSVKQDFPEDDYVDALLVDLKAEVEFINPGRKVNTIFMGGGTPSLFSAEAISRLLIGARSLLDIEEDCEITLEANPGTFEANRFQAFLSAGINRLSIGVQSFNDKHLETLGRVHNANEAIRATEIAKQAGFVNINLDLMFGLPEQTQEDAENDISLALSLDPTHISFYQLTIEPNTFFYNFPPKLPDEDLVYNSQTACKTLLSAKNYTQYEISAYAKKGYQCRHNLNYWQFGDYLGIGAGAHGKISENLPDRIIRTAKPKNPDHYLSNPEAIIRNPIQLNQLPLEYVMNHLRLKQGFTINHYKQLTGLDYDSLEPALSVCFEQNLLYKEQDRIFCTDQGWNFLDTILEKFII